MILEGVHSFESILFSTTSIAMLTYPINTIDNVVPMLTNTACKMEEDEGRVKITLGVPWSNEGEFKVCEEQCSAYQDELKGCKAIVGSSYSTEISGRGKNKNIESGLCTVLKKSVRFNTNEEIYRIDRRHSIEAKESWFCDEDYQGMQDDVDMTLKMLAAGLANGTERGDFCDRGLKQRSRDYGKKSREKMCASRRAVYVLQAHFRRCKGATGQLRGESDDPCAYPVGPEDRVGLNTTDEAQTIAAVYKEYCRSFRRTAHRIGVVDAQISRAQWNEDRCPVIPRRHSAQSA